MIMKILKILITGIISSLLFQVAAYAATPVATVSAINQTVEVKQAAATAFVPATPNMQLYEGDQLRTGTGSMAEITFGGSGSKVRIAAKSQITIEGDSNKVSFSFGKLFLAVSKGKSGMKFKTPVAVAAVMGTVGVIEYTPAEGGASDSYSVTSLDGTFAISDNAGNTKELTVGNIAKLTPTGIEVVPADILNVVKANSDVMQAAFIKVGLPPQNILSTPQGEVIRLNTANPDQQVEINSQTNSAELVNVKDHKSSANVPEIPIIQLPPSIPYIQATPLPVILK